MERAKLLRLGGYAAGVVLIIFGIGTIAIGIAGKNTAEDELSQEKIVGSPDMSPEGIALILAGVGRSEERRVW